MKPDTHLGENARQIEVSDDQAIALALRTELARIASEKSARQRSSLTDRD